MIVFISSVRSIDDDNIQPPGLFRKSIVVSTPGRDIQFTAPDKERHDLWMSVCTCLSDEAKLIIGIIVPSPKGWGRYRFFDSESRFTISNVCQSR
jgi:hypothetical protein